MAPRPAYSNFGEPPSREFPKSAASPIGNGGAVGVDPGLARRIDTLIDSHPYSDVTWGVVVQDVASGRVLYERNADRRFQPASTAKLFTAVAVLEELGPDYRYETPVLAQGERQGAVLRGDLVLRATGDPTWSSRFYDSWRTPLESIAQQVGGAGIRIVTGELLIDASAWDAESVPKSWKTGLLPWRVAAASGVLAVAEGAVRVEVTGGENPGDPASLRAYPPIAVPRIESQVETVASDSVAIWPSFRSGPDRIQLSGTIGAGEVRVLRLSMRRPVDAAANLLLGELERRGVTVEGGVRVRWSHSGDPSDGPADSPPTVEVARIVSPPMSEILAGMLKPSQNWIAEQLIRTLGAERGVRGSWAEGLRVVADVVSIAGNGASRTVLFDGSGLSSRNLASPSALVSIVRASATSLRPLLAEPGVAGTLSRRLGQMRGRLFAKSGTLSQARGLVGLMEVAGGQYAFAVLISNAQGERAVLPDAVVAAIYRAMGG